MGAHCPTELDDWRDLGGEYCYYIETNKDVNFYEAHFDCGRRGKYILKCINKKFALILKVTLVTKNVTFCLHILVKIE